MTVPEARSQLLVLRSLLSPRSVTHTTDRIQGRPRRDPASGLFVALLPVATGAAILRYGLYDLDRIISRTLAWGLLTLLLGLGYVTVSSLGWGGPPPHPARG
jgi:hypothetical protein